MHNAVFNQREVLVAAQCRDTIVIKHHPKSPHGMVEMISTSDVIFIHDCRK